MADDIIAPDSSLANIQKLMFQIQNRSADGSYDLPEQPSPKMAKLQQQQDMLERDIEQQEAFLRAPQAPQEPDYPDQPEPQYDLRGGEKNIQRLEQKKQMSLPRPNMFKPITGDMFIKGMVQRGWTPEEAAGAAGNVHVESSFAPGIRSSVPNEQSFGLLQWNGQRLRGLINMAAQKGMNWASPEAQMDYIHAERTGDSARYGGTDERAMYHKALAPGGKPEDIAERFGRFVERPKKLSDTVALRRQAAAQYYAQI